ncbi:HTH-type transcriptional repressor [Methylobacterium brachiatum]|nr:HTH-type transcriptional repressor [Methylobacterium brachiatum]
MARLTSATSSGQLTLDRILKAAIGRFARHSYEDAKLRDIAVDAGVDVAYVHRAFGSKERLFAAAVEAVLTPRLRLTGSSSEIIEALADMASRRSPAAERHSVLPIDIVARSLCSQQAVPIVRELIFRNFIDPLVEHSKAGTRRQAAMLAAVLAGISLFRDVLKTDELFTGAEDEYRTIITSVLCSCLVPAGQPADDPSLEN